MFCYTDSGCENDGLSRTSFEPLSVVCKCVYAKLHSVTGVAALL